MTMTSGPPEYVERMALEYSVISEMGTRLEKLWNKKPALPNEDYYTCIENCISVLGLIAVYHSEIFRIAVSDSKATQIIMDIMLAEKTELRRKATWVLSYLITEEIAPTYVRISPISTKLSDLETKRRKIDSGSGKVLKFVALAALFCCKKLLRTSITDYFIVFRLKCPDGQDLDFVWPTSLR